MRNATALVLLSWFAQAAADDAARDYIKLIAANDADCVMLQGRMRQVINTHAGRAIEVSLERRMGQTVQPGRVVETAPPGGEPVDLGCTRIIGGYAQDWDIIAAEFRN
ncbi:MAG: hypothetical protein ACREVE_00270 [Gammaproteobacteria bacterium]